LLLNTKIGTPEDTFFKGQPGWSFGIFNLGFEKGVNNYNILYFMLGKTMLEDWGALKYLGTIQVGAFYGLEKTYLHLLMERKIMLVCLQVGFLIQ